MPNLGRVKRWPDEGEVIPWAEEITVVDIVGFDLGLDRLLGDNEINPKCGHDGRSRDKKEEDPKIGVAQGGHDHRESETSRISRIGR